MPVPDQELKDRYEQLSDEALLELWRKDTLTETAKLVLQVELQHRGITPAVPQAPPEDDKICVTGPWVTIARLTTATEAHIVRARLESETIPAIVADEHLVTANWFLSNAVGGVRVQVPAQYIEHANEILKGLEAGEYALAENAVKTITCPKCGSGNVIPDKRGRKASLLTLFFFQLPLPFRTNAYQCKTCGLVWKAQANTRPENTQQ